jgi:DNA-binding transcriptional ArsR family regulator
MKTTISKTATMKTGIDHTFAALADPTRIVMITQLSRGPASVSELAEPHEMSLRAILKHVQVLEDAGLVQTVKHGRVRRCSLQRDGIDAATTWMDQLRKRWERRIDRLEQYAKGEHDG